MVKESAKKYALLVLMILSYFPIYFTLTVEMPLAYHVSRTAAYIGFITMWWAYILGVRRLIGKLLRDLRWARTVHKWFNIIGFLILLAHPLFLVIQVYGFDLLIPRLDLTPSKLFPIPSYGNGIVVGLAAAIILAVIWVTSALLKEKIAFRPWKSIHLLAYPLFAIVYYHMQIGSLQRLVPPLAFYNMLLFASYTALVCWQLLGRLGLGVRRFTVVKIQERSRDVVTIFLQPATGHNPIEMKIGQYVYLQLKRAGESHPFSFSGFDEKTNTIELTAKKLGRFSGEVVQMKEGDELFIDGPYGVFLSEVWETNRPIVLLAGGIGVTPFISLLSKLANHPELSERPIYLIYGCKTLQDMAFKNELDEWQKQFPKLRVTFVLDSEPNFEGEKGFITADLINRKVLEEITSCDYFVCGPPVMIKKMEAMLEYVGVPRAQIHVELFG